MNVLRVEDLRTSKLLWQRPDYESLKESSTISLSTIIIIIHCKHHSAKCGSDNEAPGFAHEGLEGRS